MSNCLVSSSHHDALCDTGADQHVRTAMSSKASFDIFLF